MLHYTNNIKIKLTNSIILSETGPISETTLPNGEVAQVEQCTDTKASCYTLWHQDKDANITVLGQGKGLLGITYCMGDG